jgi:hypothetical protein
MSMWIFCVLVQPPKEQKPSPPAQFSYPSPEKGIVEPFTRRSPLNRDIQAPKMIWAILIWLAARTVDGNSKVAVVPGWGYGGDFCNLDCKVTLQKCEGQDDPGASGFP